MVMLMEPPYEHISLQSCVRQGFPPIMMAGFVGIHVPAGTGVQGWGVRTPKAAVVAAATVGLASDVHRPKGPTFVMGAQSCIVAAGFPSVSTTDCDVTFMGAGAVPKVQRRLALIAVN